MRRDGARFGQTEAGFRLRFGLSVNRLFGSETKEEALRRYRTEHQVCGVSRNFFFGKYNTDTVVNGTKDKVFVIVPVHGTSVRKDGVPPISFCVTVFVTKF